MAQPEEEQDYEGACAAGDKVNESEPDVSDDDLESDVEPGPAYGEIRDHLDESDQHEADHAVTALDPGGDADLHAALVAANYSGPIWDHTSHELARYGIAVMRSWLRTGRITRELAKRGVPLILSEDELRAFATDEHERVDLADTIVAHALHDFKKRGVERRGWNPSGGAAITTYFTGGALYQFPNRLRARRADIRHAHPPVDTNDPDSITGEMIVSPAGVGIDPARKVVDMDQLRRACRDMTLRERRVIALYLSDDRPQHVEIAEQLDTTERAVEAVLRRLRTRLGHQYTNREEPR